MPILTLKNLYLSVGQFPLFDHITIDFEAKERIALIGRNGEGKSTLFKVILGQMAADSGEIIRPSFLRVSMLSQDLPPANESTVFETVAQGLADLSNILIEYHNLLAQTDNHDEAWMNRVTMLQQQIDQREGWQIQQRIERVMQELNLPQDKKMSELSGGWRRRVGLAQALVQEPDILLLDEPTNHLDLNAIEWLEKMLLNYPKTIIFITHDRALLRKLATRIIELDRGKLTSYPADYDTYLVRKEQALLAEERQNELFDKKLSDEEIWIRQGIKARRTRNEGRVRALKALREERKLRRTIKDKPKFEVNDPVMGGKMVIQANEISFGYTDKMLIKDFSFNIQRGDKIAIVGQNGSGKTTLLKLLIGQLKPNKGTVKQSPVNQIAFFDQNREHLNPDEIVMYNVAQGDDSIEIQGKKKHVIGYLGDFLFSPSKCRAITRTLSGGEQNRLMLAKLFAKPANVLVLDEPTNDLDIESLDVLETLLLNYQGTVIIISHDREFIDNIATHCIAFDEDNHISINVGGYSDHLQRSKDLAKQQPKQKEAPSKDKKETRSKSAPTDSAPKKLSYNEQKELTALPALIEKLEAQISEIEAGMCLPDFYSKPKDEIEQINITIARLKKELEQAYERWEALDS